MATIKTVGIKDLKNNLSAWLREVRGGVTVLVTDRNRVVAELCEPRSGYAGDSIDPRLADWISAGQVRTPTADKRPLPESPVRVPPGTVQRLVDEDRSEDDR